MPTPPSSRCSDDHFAGKDALFGSLPGMATLVRAIAARHRVGVAEVRPLSGGVANRGYLLGDDLVLRVPRSAGFADDLRKEAAVIPVARRAGVLTPDIVDFADGDMPYLLTRRVPGMDLARLALPPEQTTDALR